MLAIDAAVFEPDGRARVLVSLTGERTAADHLGRRAALVLCEQGAAELLAPRENQADT